MADNELILGSGFRIVAANSVDLPLAPPLGQHWRALQAVVACGFTVIELLHDAGGRAEWFFDGDGRHYSEMAAWLNETAGALTTAFRPAVSALRDALIFASDKAFPAVLNDFMRLGPRLRESVIMALQPEILADPAHYVLDGMDFARLTWADPAELRQTLSSSLQERFLAGMRDGELAWPSPVDGTKMPCVVGLTLNDFNSLFGFRDRANGLDIFILATEHVSRVAGLYVPAQGLVVTLGGDQSRMFLRHFASLGRDLSYHLAVYADSMLAGGVQSEPPGFATFLRGGSSAHLGHQLWNELTAIDSLITDLPPRCLPIWLVPGLPGNEIEFYGPIDALFPEINGRVRRGFADQQAVIRHAYENRLILFRATRDHISENLQRRVWAMAASHSQGPLLLGHILVFGLRVENRTVTDLEALCGLVVEEAIHLHPGCTVVFDGHNASGDARNDQPIRSHGESGAQQSPLAIERQVVEAMRTRFAGQPVQLLDTLGEPLAVSLTWSGASNGFVTLWGAGLAKYRWVTNKPGLVITSRWNLENRGDLHLYDDPAYMTNPAPLIFVPSATIQDLPSAPLLIPFEDPSYRNFTFDPDAMRLHVRAFLTALSGHPAALVALAARSVPRQRRGSVDQVDASVRGWAICSVENPVTLHVVIDDMVAGEVACDLPRPDLLAAGIGGATSGFSFTIPAAFFDGEPHVLTVCYSDGFPLPLLAPNMGDPFTFRLLQPVSKMVAT